MRTNGPVARVGAVVSRALIVFGRSRAALLTSLLVLSPLGEQLLSVGLYKVALKKLTPPRARPRDGIFSPARAPRVSSSRARARAGPRLET